MTSCSTGKHRFETCSEAQTWLSKKRQPRKRYQRGKRRKSRPGASWNNAHPYRCEVCGGWHLTSQVNEVRRAKRRMKA